MTTDPLTAPTGAEATDVPLPPTSLVLSTRGRPAFVDDLVTSISAGDEVPTEFVIIDQSDAPHPVLATGHVDGRCEIRYVWSPERGLSRGRNLGIATARHDIIAFLDDDMFVPPAWFGTLIRALVAAGTDTVVTGRVIAGEEEADGAFAPSTSPDAVARTYRGRIGRDVLLPHNMAMYRTAIEAVGPFDARLGVGSDFPSSEDNDFGYRLLEHGFAIAYVPDAVLIHRALALTVGLGPAPVGLWARPGRVLRQARLEAGPIHDATAVAGCRSPREACPSPGVDGPTPGHGRPRLCACGARGCRGMAGDGPVATMSRMAPASAGRDGSPATPSVTVIAPRAGRSGFGARELWRYRELLYFLVWRDVKVRYRQTLLGASWAILQPFITMVVFSIVFGRLVGVSSDGVPYPVFSFAGLVPWTFFATGFAAAAVSLVGSQNLLKKVYFPRLVIPTAGVVAALVDLGLAFVVLLGMMLVYGIFPTPTVVALVPLLALAFIVALGVGTWFAALNVRYRDVRYVVPFLIQVWLFATPVAYPSSLIPEPWRTVYALNPMVGVVEGTRWALLGSGTAPGPTVVVSTVVAIVVLVTGVRYFRRAEGTFADVV